MPKQVQADGPSTPRRHGGLSDDAMDALFQAQDAGLAAPEATPAVAKTSQRKGSLCVVRVLFFLQCAAGACLCNFLVLFFHARGLSYRQVGVMVGGVMPAANILGQPALTFLLDRVGRHKLGMMVCLVLSSIGTFCLQFVPEGQHAFYGLAGVAFVSNAIGSGCGPLLDSTAIYTLGQHGIPLLDYGKFRVWGAVGWGVTAVGIGFALDHFGQNMQVSPGRSSHSDTTLYISLAILHTKYTGWHQNDFNVYAYCRCSSSATRWCSAPTSSSSRPSRSPPGLSFRLRCWLLPLLLHIPLAIRILPILRTSTRQK